VCSPGQRLGLVTDEIADIGHALAANAEQAARSRRHHMLTTRSRWTQVRVDWNVRRPARHPRLRRRTPGISSGGKGLCRIGGGTPVSADRSSDGGAGGGPRGTRTKFIHIPAGLAMFQQRNGLGYTDGTKKELERTRDLLAARQGAGRIVVDEPPMWVVDSPQTTTSGPSSRESSELRQRSRNTSTASEKNCRWSSRPNAVPGSYTAAGGWDGRSAFDVRRGSAGPSSKQRKGARWENRRRVPQTRIAAAQC